MLSINKCFDLNLLGEVLEQELRFMLTSNEILNYKYFFRVY